MILGSTTPKKGKPEGQKNQKEKERKEEDTLMRFEKSPYS
jgi:hypothetical protein